MKVLSIEEQMLGFLFASRARMAIRDAKPCDPEALAAIARVMALVSPDLAEMNEWEVKHGLPVTSEKDYGAVIALIASDIAAVARPNETQH